MSYHPNITTLKKQYLQALVNAVAYERDISHEILYKALAQSLRHVAQKALGALSDIHVRIDQEQGIISTVRRWHVVDHITSPESEISISDPRADFAVAGYYEELLEDFLSSRISISTARQMMLEALRLAHAESLFASLQGVNLVQGQVKYMQPKRITLDLIGYDVEATLAKQEMLGADRFRVNDIVKAHIKHLSIKDSMCKISLTRNDKNFLRSLMHLEVPEIASGSIQIMAIAREIGVCAKIALRAVEPGIDPIGAAIGMRGSRIQSVINEMKGERVDLVLWDSDILKYSINTLSLLPENVFALEKNDILKKIVMSVSEQQIPLAIGAHGSNIRLASELCGWSLALRPHVVKISSFSEQLQEVLQIDAGDAEQLIQQGITRIEDLIQHDSLDDIQKQLAANYLLSQAIAPIYENQILALDGMNRAIYQQLLAANITDMEDLADLSVDEFLDICTMPLEKANKIILAARKSLLIV